jgi:hypothetical protein
MTAEPSRTLGRRRRRSRAAVFREGGYSGVTYALVIPPSTVNVAPVR